MLTPTPNPIFQKAPEAAQDELHQHHALTRASSRRQLENARQRANAVKDLHALPGPEESVHIIARGNFPLWSVVPAVLTLASPATIDALHIATLGFSKSNAADLFALIDAGKVRSVWIVCSVYFERQDPAEFSMMAEGLKARGQKIAAIRSHAKVITMKLSDGRALAIESSANLRSCRNIEQIALVNSEPLRAFHAGWIEEVVANAAR